MHFKTLQQEAISFGSSFLLNMWYRLHHYVVYHKDISYSKIYHSTPKAAGSVLCKQWQVGRSEHSGRRGGENNLKGEMQKSRSLLPLCSSSFAPPDRGNKTSACLRYTPPQLHPPAFRQHWPTCGAPPAQSFSMAGFSFSLEYSLWRGMIKAGITQGYISAMLFIQLHHKLSIQLPCFCLEGSFHLH